MLEMLQRVYWTTSGWTYPTRNISDGGYPAEHHFGHEAWNFQLDDAVDGHMYGYLYYEPSEQKVTEAGGTFRIGFWARHPRTGEKLVVGYYHQATLPTDSDYEALDVHFRDRGVFERRAMELLEAVPELSEAAATKEVEDSVHEHFLKFRCPVDEVEAFQASEYFTLPGEVDGKSIGQYFTRPTFVSSIPTRRRGRGASRTRPPGSEGRTTPLAEDGYYRETAARLKRILPRHNELSNQFATWLRSEGYRDVVQEKEAVDVEFKDGEELCRAELKISYPVGTTKSIREALGQLFEYNYFGAREPAACWYIVLDQRPSEDDLAYVARLRAEHQLPLSLGWRLDDGEFELRRYS